MLSNEQKAKAFDLLLKQVEQSIEDEIPNWLNENPYWDIDDEDCFGNKTHRCPPTNTTDAREALCESFVSQGEDAGLGDFFEYVIYCIYGEPMSKNNVYRDIKEEAKQEVSDRIKAEGEASLSLCKFQKQMIDNVFESFGFPKINKTEGSAQ